MNINNLERKLLNDVPLMITCIDTSNQKVVFSNKQFTSHLGYSTKELQEISIYSIIANNNLVTFAKAILEFDIENKECEIDLIHKNGQLQNTRLLSVKLVDKPDIVSLYFIDNTQCKEKSKEFNVFKQIFSSSLELKSLVSKDMIYIEVNNAYTEHFGLSRNEIINMSVKDLHGNKADEIIQRLQQTIDTGKQVRGQSDINNPRGNRDVKSVDALFRHCYDTDGKIFGVIVSARDITSFKEEELALEKKIEYYKTLFKYSPDLLASVNIKSGVIIEANKMLEKHLGYKSNELNGKNVFDFHLGADNGKLANAIASLKYENRAECLEIFLISKQGEHVDTHLQATLLVNSDDDHIAIFVWKDISDQKKLAYKASHDSLTKLLNRTGFLDKLEKPPGCSKTRSLSYIDVDNFKILNDSYGHLMGDKFLKDLAGTLKVSLRKEDYICRIGGDEFVIIFIGIKLLRIKYMMQRVMDQLNLLIQKTVEYNSSKLGISIGIAEMCTTESIEQVLQRADNACYESKRQGKNRITIFTSKHKNRVKSKASNDHLMEI